MSTDRMQTLVASVLLELTVTMRELRFQLHAMPATSARKVQLSQCLAPVELTMDQLVCTTQEVARLVIPVSIAPSLGRPRSILISISVMLDITVSQAPQDLSQLTKLRALDAQLEVSVPRLLLLLLRVMRANMAPTWAPGQTPSALTANQVITAWVMMPPTQLVFAKRATFARVVQSLTRSTIMV